jgi:hypothetical protein
MRFTWLVDMIAESLTTMAVAMPRFEEYISHYPSSPRLQLLLKDIYDGYVTLCINCVKFCRRNPLGKPCYYSY